MGFHDIKNWGKTVCNLIRKNATDSKIGNYTSAPYYEDNAYWFNFEDGKETYKEWFNKLSLEEQIEQLKSFMDEVFNYVNQMKK